MKVCVYPENKNDPIHKKTNQSHAAQEGPEMLIISN